VGDTHLRHAGLLIKLHCRDAVVRPEHLLQGGHGRG
jgi:hypothetical protein